MLSANKLDIIESVGGEVSRVRFILSAHTEWHLIFHVVHYFFLWSRLCCVFVFNCYK